MTRLILTGGGTGGHIYPALAIAGGLRERWPQAEMLYIGAKNSLESQAAAAAGLDFQGITAEGWQGRRLGTLARATHAAFQGQEEARTLLKAFEPAAVIGTGGYVCLPVCAAAARLGIPVYIHEQNAFPGLANRLTALWAKVVMVSFEEAIHRLPPGCRKKARLTGLPVRESIGAAGREAGLAHFQLAEGKTTVLAAGGSLGAQSINRAMLHVVKNLYGREDVQILLAAGRRDYQPMAEALRDLGLTWQGGADGGSAGADPAGPGHAERVGSAQESQRDPGSARPASPEPASPEPASPGAGNVRLLSYIERMDLAYAAADVFVGRAGASTLAEIALCRLPAILIPYPFATANHQTFNAASLADKGGAVLLEDRKLTGPLLLRSLQDIIFNEEKRRGMADCAYLAARQRALPDILDILAEVME